MHYKKNLKEHSESPGSISRRTFLGTSFCAAVGWKIFGRNPLRLASTADKENNSRIKKYRTRGRTGFQVSDIGFDAGNLMTKLNFFLCS